MSEDKQALIQYRLSQAKDSIKEAEVLLNEGLSFRSVINRLYYALFYAVLALLQKKQLGTSKHTGAIALFDREFIKSGILDKELSRTLHRAFELRQKADYMEKMEVTREDIEEMLPKAKAFITEIEMHLYD